VSSKTKVIRPSRTQLKRVALLLLATPGVLFLIATLTPLNIWWAEFLRGEEWAEKGDVLILLSGSAGEEGAMGWSSYLRTTYASVAFRNGGFKDELVSGGAFGSTVPVSKAMGAFLKFEGVPAEAIHLETRSRSTRENALYSALLLKDLPGRKVLLTSDFHVFRARRAFAKAGIEVAVQPVPDVLKRAASRRSRWTCFLELTEETVKIGYYWARGWI
jgi:uncharacterized SAM-binding protein YcdF (DUF218 family)